MMTRPRQSTRQTIEQSRAADAWRAIDAIEQEKTFKDKYGTVIRGLPAMIQTNGLAVSMAFLKAKEGTGSDRKLEFARAYEHLSRRIIHHLGMKEKHADDELMTLIELMSTDVYRRATSEAIAYSIWLKRYVESKGWKSSGS